MCQGRGAPIFPANPEPDHDGERFLTTVLMTDIVGSTHAVAQTGDRRWRALLADHYADSRAEVARAGGEVIDTTGDGVLAILEGPTRAVRAAVAIQAAARICALGGADEVNDDENRARPRDRLDAQVRDAAPAGSAACRRSGRYSRLRGSGIGRRAALERQEPGRRRGTPARTDRSSPWVNEPAEARPNGW
jgi:hypothetical protein